MNKAWSQIKRHGAKRMDSSIRLVAAKNEQRETNKMKHFKAKIYPIGINWAVDVPREISNKMKPDRGYIRIKGKINGFEFIQTLVPVKNAPYRLFVNLIMMKGGQTAVGETASFEIEQNFIILEKLYPMPKLLAETLAQHQLQDQFEQLRPARKKDIFKYLSYIKTEETMVKNIAKIVNQLKSNAKDVRIP